MESDKRGAALALLLTVGMGLCAPALPQSGKAGRAARKGKPVAGATRRGYIVEHRGAMRDMFAANDIRGKVPLSLFRGKHRAYALGPLEKLDGEVMVWGGTPYVSRVRDGAVAVETSYDAKAVFLVWAKVAGWQKVAVPEAVRTYKQLEAFVARAARARVDVTRPFPFLLRGKAARVNWHVNAYRPDDTPLTHEKHDAAKFKGVTGGRPVDILGFYSDRHKGIFTYHTTNMHLHVRYQSGDVVGHLDDISLSGGMTLYLPAKQRVR